MPKKFKGIFLSIIIYCSWFVLASCAFKSATKTEKSDEKNPRLLTFKESIDALQKLRCSLNSFKGRVKINFKDKKEGKEKVFNCAIVYKKTEFIRLDAYSTIGASFFKLVAKPKAFDLYIPMKNMVMSAELGELRFLQNKKWRSILPLISLDLFHLVGIPYEAKPLFMKRELISRNLYYSFDSGNYGILTFDVENQNVIKNEQFDRNGTKIAQFLYKEYKKFGSLLYPCNISIADYNTDTYIKIDLLNFEPLGFSEMDKDYALKCPIDVKRECVAKIEEKLMRWFIIEDVNPNEKYPKDCALKQ